jgi:hypothetical protein
MKMCGGLEVIVALTHNTGSMMAPRAGVDGMEQNILYPCREFNPQFLDS